ncbi:hypothetical protein F5B21DRAFT_505883 [Xylaria acuta]|nr:hypothetical protein F5B21DRAFT_505883 [Xylaria acuta]
MQSQSNASISGEEELRQVAQRCLDSPETRLFVVGPSRSGKSTRLPAILAALSGKKVICVQPDDRVAQCHADWVQSNGADTFADKKVSVGYHKDEEDMKFNFIPRHDVTYVSSRWLYRMVIGVRFNESRPFASERSMMEQRRKHKDAVGRYRIVFPELIGYVLLDEVHAQSVIQELGYMAVHAATSGLVEAPIGFSKGTKVICTTAYPENHTFHACFDLSDEEIKERLIKIDTGLAPTPGNGIQERFLPEDDNTLPEYYHPAAVQKAKEILMSNKEARILLLMDTLYSKRNIVRQNQPLKDMVKVLDLETEDGWKPISRHEQGPIVILATLSFTSRIPVEGITDVICPLILNRAQLSPKLHREIFLEVYLDKCELAWAKNHLDPTLKEATIHYMFKGSVHSTLDDVSGARFRTADFVDILLGTIRLCHEHVLGDQSPMRFPIQLNTAERAFRHLTVRPSTISPGPQSSSLVTRWIMSPKNRTALMLKLMDRCGLNRRHAFFLGYLEQKLGDEDMKATRQRFLIMVAVAMVVFDESPILRLKSRPSPQIESVRNAFHGLQDLFHLGRRGECTSDSWINAVVWMDIKRGAVAAGSEITKFAREHYKSKQFLVDQVPLEAAESKLRFLARMVDLDERSQDTLCNGSFLEEVEKFHEVDRHDRAKAIAALFESYLYAFQFNLVYVRVEEGSVKMFDVSSGFAVDYDWTHLAVDLCEQVERAKNNSRDGFYATCTTRTYFGYRNLTVIPLKIVCQITEGTDESPGAYNLQVHLNLRSAIG